MAVSINCRVLQKWLLLRGLGLTQGRFGGDLYRNYGAASANRGVLQKGLGLL